MSETDAAPHESWVPQACTLPTVEQPVRLAEFEELFATGVRSVHRTGSSRLRLELVPDARTAAWAADLAVREAGCCSFFTFTLQVSGGRVLLDVAVPPGQVAVLDALAGRATAGVGR